MPEIYCPPQIPAQIPFGTGMKWKDVYAQRTLGASYQNQNAYTIFVFISAQMQNASGVKIKVSGYDLNNPTMANDGPANIYMPICFPVHPSAYYSVSIFGTGVSNLAWLEFS